MYLYTGVERFRLRRAFTEEPDKLQYYTHARALPMIQAFHSSARKYLRNMNIYRAEGLHGIINVFMFENF